MAIAVDATVHMGPRERGSSEPSLTGVNRESIHEKGSVPGATAGASRPDASSVGMGDPASGFDLSIDASESEIRFLRVQASVSAWSLSASVQELVSRYNTTGDDIAAAEFSLLRAKYVAALIE